MALDTVEKVLESIPHPNIAKISGPPDYEQLNTVTEQLCENAAALPSSVGNGANGYLYLVLKPAVMATIDLSSQAPPVNPQPADPTNLTAAQLSTANRQYDKAKAAYRESIAVMSALRKQLINAVEEKYVKHLKRPYTGYTTLPVLTILTHLYDKYANITPSDKQDNIKRMNMPYDPNDPPAVLFTQVQEAADYAAHANTPFSNEQLVDAAYNLVFNTGVFSEECKRWRQRMPPLTKTWADFQTWFADEHQEWCEDQKLTAQHRNSQANAAYEEDYNDHQEQTIEAIANLATATSSDRATVAQLTRTIAQLTADLKTAQDKVVKTLEENVSLAKQLAQTKRGSANNASPATTNEPGAKVHYCWTHGFECDHSSFKCTDQKEGHQRHATARNTMNGSQLRKEMRKQRLMAKLFD